MFIANGDIEKGVEHFANAVIVCGQPTQLLQVLQQTLPAQVFTLLIRKMQEYSENMPESKLRSAGGNDTAKITEVDELEWTPLSKLPL